MLLRVLAVAVGVVAARELRLGDWMETQVVSASSNASAFGMSVGVTQDRVVVGSSGAAWKFVREFGSWTPSRNSFYPAAAGETARVATDDDLTLVATPSRTATYRRDQVKESGLPGGIGVAVSGDVALIATESEVVSVFLIENVWTVRGVVARYRRPAVAVSTMAVIGGEGEVHSYVRLGNSWIERDIVTQDVEDFGTAVAVDGATLAVGARDSAWIYEKNFDDAGWSLVTRLSKPGDFGASVAVASNGLVVIGAPGAASVYSWTPDDDEPELVAARDEPDSLFGTAVDLAFDDTITLVVGDPGLNVAFIYTTTFVDADPDEIPRDDNPDDDKRVRVVHRPDALAYLTYYILPLLLVALLLLFCIRCQRGSLQGKPRAIVSAEVRLVPHGTHLDDVPVLPVVLLETPHHGAEPPSADAHFVLASAEPDTSGDDSEDADEDDDSYQSAAAPQGADDAPLNDEEAP